MQAFYDTLRAEIEPNSKVSVCLVSPGYVKTNISKNALSASGEVSFLNFPFNHNK